jgi:hypothetical protein
VGRAKGETSSAEVRPRTHLAPAAAVVSATRCGRPLIACGRPTPDEIMSAARR